MNIDNRTSPIKRIGIVFKDKLSVNMFTDFLKSIYLKGVKIEMVSYTLFNTPDIIEQQLGNLSEMEENGIFPVILIKGPDTINLENPALVKSVEMLDQVVILRPRDFPNPEVLKGADALAPVMERWKTNLERLASLNI